MKRDDDVEDALVALDVVAPRQLALVAFPPAVGREARNQVSTPTKAATMVPKAPMIAETSVHASAPLQPRVERVAQAVAHEVDGKHGDEDGEPGKAMTQGAAG